MSRVDLIHVASCAGGPMRSVEAVRAWAGQGLENDRYSLGNGYYSRDRRVSRDLTLIEAETIKAIWHEERIALNPGETRRNVTTSDVRLNDLVGHRFWVGDVLCVGTRLCEPCQYLSQVTGRPLLRSLVRRGGLRADILTNGQILVGDLIRVEPDEVVEPMLGVGVIVVREGRVLLGRRTSSLGQGTWSVPGGKPHPGESLESCAVRELREETGLEAGKPRLIGHTIDKLPEIGKTYRTTFFRVESRFGQPNACEPDKCDGWQWFGWRELPLPLFHPLASFHSTANDPTNLDQDERSAAH